MAGSVRSVVDNHERELKHFSFWTYYEIVKLRDNQLETMEVGKKIQVGKK